MSIKSPLEQTDLRVRRTHKLLWEALMVELSERTIEEITVSDICERAMVHRTTFYKHYEDKYALLEQGIRQMYDDLLAEEEHLPPNAYSVEHPPPYFIRLFEHAAQHQHFYKLMLCGEGIGRFQKLVKEVCWPGGLSMTCLFLRIRWRNTCSRPMALRPHFLDARWETNIVLLPVGNSLVCPFEIHGNGLPGETLNRY